MTKPSGMPAERREHTSIVSPVGAHRKGRRRRDLLSGANQPEYRPERRLSPGRQPATPEEWDAAFREMAANDPELRAWRGAERRGDLAGGRPR